MNTQDIVNQEITGIGQMTTTVNENWAQVLMTKGVIVSLHIGRWRAQAKLTYKDLGFDDSDPTIIEFFKKYFSLGRKLLVDSEEKKLFDRIESKAREVLSRHSYDTVFGAFVPYTSFHPWKKINDEIESKYMKARDEFIERFDKSISEAATEYREMASQLWQRVSILQNQDKEAFVEGFVTRLQSLIPTVETVKNSFYYTCTYSMVPMPSFLADDVLKAKIKTTCSGMSDESIKRISSMTESVAAEYCKKKKEIVDQFLQATVGNLRSKIVSVCDDIGSNIKDHKRLAKRKVKSIRKNIEKLELLNFFDDEQINRSLNRIKSEITEFDGENIESMKNAIKEVAETSRESIIGPISGDIARFANLEM